MNNPRILTQSALSVLGNARPVRWIAVGALALAGMVAAFAFAPDTAVEIAPTRFIARELALPTFAAPAAAEAFWREERIQRGDTLGSVLARLGVDDAAAQLFLRTDASARPLYQLRPGKALRVQIDDDGRLLALRYLTQSGQLLTVDRIGAAFAAQSAMLPGDVRLELRSAEVRSSLFGAADAAGLPDAITMQLADVFSADIDFLHDLRRGDRFTVLYEVRYVDGEAMGTGRILAAEYVNARTAYRAFLWRAPDGSGGYYGEDGRSRRQAFLRSPVEFSRITSGFSLARFHPFLQTWRAHKGVDFAAPTGTPVHAAGEGRVVFAGRQGGYGNVVILQHPGPYSTVYAHLSQFAKPARPGTRVAQGEVIGYVGQTGWATGPHLHYEFRVSNQQRDPMHVALPTAQPLSADQQAAFLQSVAPLVATLSMGRELLLAGGE